MLCVKKQSQIGRCIVTEVKSFFYTKQSFLMSPNAFSLVCCITCATANFLVRNCMKVLRTFLEQNNYTLVEFPCGHSYSAVEWYE